MGKRIKEFYISIDIEADGPCPGLNSMLQFGAVFYDDQGTIVDEYGVNLEQITGGKQDPGTMKWWATQEVKFPGIWTRLRENLISPQAAMEAFGQAVTQVSTKLHASPICVAYPAGFDFTWLYYYLLTFTGKSCVGFSCLDMKTMAMTLLQKNYSDSAKKRFPKHWFDPSLPHNHNALDDAREQGYIFFQMKKDLQSAVKS